MIIVRSPLRVSFFGGGTDHPTWFKGPGSGRGAVLSTSINKYVYLTLRQLPPIFDFKYRVAWSIVEQVKEIADIRHPVVREVLRHYADEKCGYEVSFNSDLPARSGLGSSSAFTVAALNAISKHCNRTLTKHELCAEAIKIEQDYLQEPVGCQDQVAVGYGGFNRIDFHKDGAFTVNPVDISPKRLRAFEGHIMLFFTGFTRDAGNIEKAKFQNITPEKEKSLNTLYDLVDKAQNIVEDPRASLSDFGYLLDETWQAKRSLSKEVSNPAIDGIYDTAVANGAYGGKLLGAGGGGFLLFFVPPDRQEKVRSAIRTLSADWDHPPVEVPVSFESEGCTTVLYQPDYDSSHIYEFGKKDLIKYA
ncbi:MULTISPECIES: kinase [Asticcacaulis]|uniref:GHMP family kinase ATP-binding protein n=1 Tax=Asticcacaulis TaxID=76890 RepID=UPI001AE4848F|nr:kinase [Asticcacaulis sp. BE141]MBP2161874.1 D-glycero-alpha-D-manno-heptose-7-phosphate kinase [Asticcacaulis solisilvae]MDR6802920.1 D-glycero-alpha-D-manno-heptose-7-phosphate kinase [Asticcacaulis sp. BE141]